jgi:hypothetical protein
MVRSAALTHHPRTLVIPAPLPKKLKVPVVMADKVVSDRARGLFVSARAVSLGNWRRRSKGEVPGWPREHW